MYCVNCGVKLADTEERCPLCGAEVLRSASGRAAAEPLFSPNEAPAPKNSRWAWMLVVTVLYLLPMLVVLLCDWQADRAVSWAGIVIGAMLLCYELLLLPLWFEKPNPVIFVPCGFGALGLYLLYLCRVTGGRWFMGFAFPLVVGLGLIVTAMTALLRYVRRGKLYILGGGALALGAFMPGMELLLERCFQRGHFAGWALYPAAALGLLGLLLLFLALCRPAREAMERKFFF